MPHLTNRDLALAVLDVISVKDRDLIKKELINLGKQVALNRVISIINTRTGLPQGKSVPVGNIIITILKKQIRGSMA